MTPAISFTSSGALGTRTRTILGLVYTAVVWGLACSPPPPILDVHSAIPSAIDSPAVPTITRAVCVAPSRPATWTASDLVRMVTTPEGVRFGPGAQAGDLVFGQFNSREASGIGFVRMSDGELSTIATYGPDTGGLYAMAAEWPWVVWTQGESKTNISNWTLRAWNQETGLLSQVATSSRADGSFVSGQPPIPVLLHGRLVWSQPLARSAVVPDAELRARDLVTGSQTVVATGVISSPVVALGRLIWARSVNGAFSLEAADQTTLERTALPSGLASPGAIAALAGSPTMLAWSTDVLQEVSVYDAATSRRVIYRSPDINHYLQFPQLAGHFVVAYGGVTSTVIDLETAAAFDVRGTVVGSSTSILIEEPSRPPSQKGEFVASRLTSIASDSAPAITGCK